MRVHVDAHLRSAGLALRAVCCCMLGCCSVEAVPCWHHNFAEFLVSGERLVQALVLISPVCRLAGTDHNIVIVLLSSVCSLIIHKLQLSSVSSTTLIFISTHIEQ